MWRINKIINYLLGHCSLINVKSQSSRRKYNILQVRACWTYTVSMWIFTRMQLRSGTNLVPAKGLLSPKPEFQISHAWISNKHLTFISWHSFFLCFVFFLFVRLFIVFLLLFSFVCVCLVLPLLIMGDSLKQPKSKCGTNEFTGIHFAQVWNCTYFLI